MDDFVRDRTGLVHTNVVADLRQELARLVEEADRRPAMAALLDGSASRALYLAFLVQTRHYVERTFPVLAAAGHRQNELGRHAVLADLYVQKADEEADHDILIDRDLKALGVEPEAALAAGPGRWVKAYNAWIEATAAGEHPSGFLGSAYVLEGLAVHRAGPIAKALRAANTIAGIGSAVTFLELHAEADIGHVDDLEVILGGLDDEGECEAIAMTAAVTRSAYLGMLDELAALGQV